MKIEQEGKQVWQAVRQVPDMQSDEIVVWKFVPEHLEDFTDSLQTFLSVEEKKRLERFSDLEFRKHFIQYRGVLHFLLSSIINTSPDDIKIQSGQQGKPKLNMDQHSHPISFNISHTEGICLIAMSKRSEVGIDVERVRPVKEMDRLANTYLSSEEYSDWQRKNEQERVLAFYSSWCAKEAILKAVGCGLTIHPGQLNISEALAGQPLRGVQEDGSLFEFRDYALQALSLGDDYQSWLAVFGGFRVLNLYEFSAQLLTNSSLAFSDGRNVEK